MSKYVLKRASQLHGNRRLYSNTCQFMHCSKRINAFQYAVAAISYSILISANTVISIVRKRLHFEQKRD